MSHSEGQHAQWQRFLNREQAAQLAEANAKRRRDMDERIRNAVAEAQHVAFLWGSGHWTGRPGGAP